MIHFSVYRCALFFLLLWQSAESWFGHHINPRFNFGFIALRTLHVSALPIAVAPTGSDAPEFLFAVRLWDGRHNNHGIDDDVNGHRSLVAPEVYGAGGADDPHSWARKRVVGDKTRIAFRRDFNDATLIYRRSDDHDNHGVATATTPKAPSRKSTVAEVQPHNDERFLLAVHRSKVGTDQEHWSLHVHPASPTPLTPHPNRDPDEPFFYIAHAGMPPNTNHVLHPAHTYGYTPYQPSLQGPHHHIIGSFPNQHIAEKAVEETWYARLDKKFPEQNCVDWTKCAVRRLVDKGFLDKKGDKQTREGLKKFEKLTKEHGEDVRKRTAHAFDHLLPPSHDQKGVQAGHSGKEEHHHQQQQHNQNHNSKHGHGQDHHQASAHAQHAQQHHPAGTSNDQHHNGHPHSQGTRPTSNQHRLPPPPRTGSTNSVH